MKIVYFGQGGVIPCPEKDGYVIMPYAGEHLDTPLFRAHRVVNLHPSAYAVYQIYEVMEMNKFEKLVKQIEGLPVRLQVDVDYAFAVVPIEPDMIEEALSFGALSFGIEVFWDRDFSEDDIEFVAVFPFEVDAEAFAEYHALPTDYLEPRQHRTVLEPSLEWSDTAFYFDGEPIVVSALYTGEKWAIYTNR